MPFPKPIILSMLLFLIAYQVVANDKSYPTDSLRQALAHAEGENVSVLLDRLAEHYSLHHPDSSLYYANQLLQRTKGKNLDYWQARGNQYITWYHIYQSGDHEKILKHGDLSYHFFLKAGKPIQALHTRFLMGISLKDKGLDNIALDHFMKVIDEADGLGFMEEKVQALCEVALTFNLRKDTINALKYIEQARKLVNNDPKASHLKPRVYNDMAMIYGTVGKLDLSIQALKEILHLRTGRAKSISINNIARTYVTLEAYDSALKYLDMGQELRQTINTPIHDAYAYKEYASAYLGMKQYRKALEYAKKVYKIGKFHGNSGHVEDGLRSTRDAYVGIRDHAKSTEYAIAYTNFLKKLYAQKRESLIQEMESKYQTALKDKAIVKLEAKQLVDEKQKSLLQRTILFILMLTCLLIVLFWYIVKKQKIEQLLTKSQLSVRENELIIKEQKLSQFATLIHEKNYLLEQLEGQVSGLQSNESEQLSNINKLTQSIILTEDDWKEFKTTFENVHTNFFAKLKTLQPDLTTAEIRILALMKLNLSTKETSNMLGIAADSVTRTKYRIRKKLDIEDKKGLHQFVADL